MDPDPNASPRSGSNAGDPPHSTFNSYVRTSCDLCKRLKIKCEKQGDSCLQCLNRGATCLTTMAERKKREPTRSTSLLDLEDRLKRIESVVTASGLDSGAAFTPAASESPLAIPTKLTDPLSTLAISGQGKTRFIGGSSGLSLFSPQGLEWITEKTDSDKLSRLISTLATNTQTHSDKTTADLYRPLFASEREPLPPKHIADRYVDYFFDSYNKLFPLYDRASFDQSYELQYSGHPPSGSAWYASLNMVLCLGCLLLQVRAGDNTSDNTEIKVWKKYLRNASGCFLELLFEEDSLEAIQALIGMAVVQQVHLAPQAVYTLIAAAGRLAYGIGLHRNLNDWGFSEAEMAHRKNVFWIIYTMDKTIALRLGQPSVMNDDDIGIDLPFQERPLEVGPDGTTTKTEMFRYHVQLARLESRIYSGLYSARGQARSPLERMRLVGELDKALIEWKEQLPVDIQPEKSIRCQEDLVLPIVMMHFSYLNCLTIIHRVSIHHGSWTSTNHGQHKSTLQDDQNLNPRVYASQAICLAAARQSIQLLNSVNFKSRAVEKSGIWMLLYYPLSNFLTLFANTLQNPQNPQVLSDLKLMEMVIALISEHAFHVNVPAANAAHLFVELANVARKLVEKTNTNIPKPAKRNRDDYNHGQDNPQVSVQDYHVSEALAGLENCGQQSLPSIANADEYLTASSSVDTSISEDIFLQQHIGDSLQPFYPSDPIDQSTIFNTPMFSDNVMPHLDAAPFAPLMSEYFEWDLASLWGLGQGNQIFH